MSDQYVVPLSLEIPETIIIDGQGCPEKKQQSTRPSSGKYGFNWTFLKGLWRLATYNEFPKDLLLLLLLIAVITGNLVVGSYTGKVTGQFYQVIVDRDSSKFGKVVWQSALIVTASSLLETSIKFVLSLIGYRWRKNLVLAIQNRYFSNQNFYKLLNLDHLIDNPDQRITQDIDLLATTLGVVLRSVIEGPLQIVYYGYLCFSTISWYSPLLVAGFWLLAYVINMFVMIPGSSLTFRQEQLEGNFRFSHVRIRENSESIALYGGENSERNISQITFTGLMKNKLRLIQWVAGVTATSNFFAYFSTVINYSVVGLPILQGWKIPPSAGGAAKYVSNASFQLLMFINGFTQINNASPDMTKFIGYSNRLAQLIEAMDKFDEKLQQEEMNQLTKLDQPSLSHSIQAQDNSPYSPEITPLGTLPTISLNNITVFTPTGVSLVRNLNLSIIQGTALFITGPSGSGKSSLLRCIAGLWKSFNGQITRPSSVLFVPQRPYLPYGTLRTQILYPHDEQQIDSQGNQLDDKLTAETLYSLLKDMELEYLVHRPNAVHTPTWEVRQYLPELTDSDDEQVLGETVSLLAKNSSEDISMQSKIKATLDQMEESNQNWTEVLSPGEQQRLGLARVLFHRPTFAILDESTSCVDETIEAKFYQLCSELGISVITVGHRTSLKKFHQQILKLERYGQWVLEPLQ